MIKDIFEIHIKSKAVSFCKFSLYICGASTIIMVKGRNTEEEAGKWQPLCMGLDVVDEFLSVWLFAVRFFQQMSF